MSDDDEDAACWYNIFCLFYLFSIRNARTPTESTCCVRFRFFFQPAVHGDYGPHRSYLSSLQVWLPSLPLVLAQHYGKRRCQVSTCLFWLSTFTVSFLVPRCPACRTPYDRELKAPNPSLVNQTREEKEKRRQQRAQKAFFLLFFQNA